MTDDARFDDIPGTTVFTAEQSRKGYPPQPVLHDA